MQKPSSVPCLSDMSNPMTIHTSGQLFVPKLTVASCVVRHSTKGESSKNQIGQHSFPVYLLLKVLERNHPLFPERRVE